MTIQYNVPVKVLDKSKEWIIQNSLQGYRVFTDRSGNLDSTCFSRENIPYVGDIIVVKTIKEDAAKTAHDVLSGIEGLVVLPTTECDLKEDQERVDKVRQENEELRQKLPLFFH